MAIRRAWNKGLKGLQPWHNTSGLGKNIDFKGRGKSCSEARKGVPLSEDHKQALSKSQTKKWADPEYHDKQSESMEGREVWNEGIEMPEHLRGKNHPCWKGGITTESQKARNSIKYKSWRTAVFERDDYTCRGCGERGCCLEAHHIKSFAEHKDLRFVIDNGITYCIKCHAINDPQRMRTLKKD